MKIFAKIHEYFADDGTVHRNVVCSMHPLGAEWREFDVPDATYLYVDEYGRIGSRRAASQTPRHPVFDLVKIIIGLGIELDKDEAAELGAPNNETISLWSAICARHGYLIAKICCLGLWLVQFRHCRDQIAGVPMHHQNYLRAVILLVVAVPFVYAIGTIRKLFLWVFV